MKRALLVAVLIAVGLTTGTTGQVYQGHGTGGGGGGGGASTSAANTWTALQTFSGGASIPGTFTSTIDAIGATSTDGFILRNTTPAALGAQQWSPRVCWQGNGWRTTATAQSESVVFCQEVQPVQGAADPTGNWTLKASVNGGTFADRLIVTTTGNVTLNGSTTISGNVSLVGILALGVTTPTLSSGFGTGAALSAGKAWAFRWNVGTGGVATTGVIALGSTAFQGWNCSAVDLTNAASFITVQTASTTTTASFANFSRTTGAPAAWTASDILAITCTAY